MPLRIFIDLSVLLNILVIIMWFKEHSRRQWRCRSYTVSFLELKPGGWQNLDTGKALIILMYLTKPDIQMSDPDLTFEMACRDAFRHLGKEEY